MNKILASLLMLILSMQALLASADMHQFHQPVQGHLENNVLHADALEYDLSAQLDADDQAEPCKHCCQCHGGGAVYVSGQSLSITIPEIIAPIAHLTSPATPRVRSPELRPPIV